MGSVSFLVFFFPYITSFNLSINLLLFFFIIMQIKKIRVSLIVLFKCVSRVFFRTKKVFGNILRFF